MSRFTLKLLSAFLFIYIINACSPMLQSEKPVENYTPTPTNVVSSDIPLSIELDVKKLETSLNKSLQGLIYEGDSVGSNNLSVKVWKVQDFSFNVTNNYIEYKLPLKVSAKYSWSINKLGIKLSDSYTANGTILLNYRTGIFINRDWKLFARTESLGYQWIETPKIEIAGYTLPIKRVADLALNKSSESITKQIDNSFSKMVSLKSYIKDAWNKLSTPFLILPENQLWIKITPSNLYVSPFTSSKNILKLKISLESKIESIVGAQPIILQDFLILPEFNQIVRPDKPFNLNISTDITYNQISTLVKSQIINKTFTEGKRSITITDLNIFGSNGKMVVGANVTGSINGTIYFNGRLVYNQSNSSIEFAEPEFDIKTKNLLLKSADWLLHGLILKKITPYLTYSIKDNLEEVKREANKNLSLYSITDGITISGSLTDLSVNSIDLIPGAVRVTSNLKGNIYLNIGEISL